MMAAPRQHRGARRSNAAAGSSESASSAGEIDAAIVALKRSMDFGLVTSTSQIRPDAAPAPYDPPRL